METKTIHGVVRHYWTASSIAEERANPENFYRKSGVHYHPYCGCLKKPTDLEDFKDDPLWLILRELPDGEEVEITVRSRGKSPCATGFVWAWAKSGEYVRMPESDFERMVRLEMSGDFRREHGKYRVELSDLEEERKNGETKAQL